MVYENLFTLMLMQINEWFMKFIHTYVDEKY